MSKRILVTGGLGTLGKRLVDKLRSAGHVVFTVDLAHSHDENHRRADVANFRQLENVFDALGIDVVYHLAAEFGRNNGEHYYEQLWQSNAIGTRNVIDLCIQYRAHLIFASSSEAYGDIADQGILFEHHAKTIVPKFHNEYALSKWTNEKQIEIAIPRGLKATILRFFNAYGPGEHYSPYRSVVCLFAYRLMHHMPITVYKDYHRVFMYVDDLINTVAGVVDRLDTLHNGEIYNVGGIEYTSVQYLSNLLIELLAGKGFYTDSQIQLLPKEEANITNKRPDVSKAVFQLGHNPTVTLREGLPKTLDWLFETYGVN